MSDSLIAITGKDYVLLAADANFVVWKQTEDKIYELEGNQLLAANGENGDRVQFAEYIQKNLTYQYFKNDRALSTHASAMFVQARLAEFLRSSPYQTNMFLAGVDFEKQEDATKPKIAKPALYFIDYMASCEKVDYGAQGYAMYFLLGLMDKLYPKNREDMTLEEGIKLMAKCIRQVKKRLLLNIPKFIVKIVDANGTRAINLDVDEVLKAEKDEEDQQMKEK